MKKLLLLPALAFLLLTPLAEAATRGPIPAGGFRSCAAAKKAGYTNMKRGEPAYHPRLDRDKDGVACDK